MEIKVNLVNVPVGKIVPNPWNPNKQTDFIFDKEVASIKEHGFLQPILCRQIKGGKYEIIDGEHRFRAGSQGGMKEIPVNNLGKISDDVAKKLTIIMNETRGQADSDLLGKLLKDLEESVGHEDLVASLPFQQSLIDDLLAQSKVDWDQITPNLQPDNYVQETQGGPQEPTAPPVGPGQADERGAPINENAPQDPEWNGKVVGEQVRYEYLKCDKDVYQGLSAQLRRINKFMAKQGSIPEEELESAGFGMALQVVTQHFAEMNDAALKKLLKSSAKED